MEIALQKDLAEELPPKDEVILGVGPEVGKAHVSDESDAVENVLVIGGLFEDVVATNPLGPHKGKNLGLLFGPQQKQIFFR